MNKKDLTDRVYGVIGKKRESEYAVNALFNAIAASLIKGEKVSIQNFGVFRVSIRSSRTWHNPRTNQPVYIPIKKHVRFIPSKALKQALNQEQEENR